MRLQHSAQLEYAPPPRWHQRRRWRWVMLLLLGTIGAGVYEYRKPLRDRAELLYWQHKCMTFSMGPDEVAYEPDPKEAVRVGKLPQRRQPPVLWYFDEIPEPPGKRAPYTILDPHCLSEYLRRRPSLGYFGEALVFLHGRRSPAGHERLVLVWQQYVSHNTQELMGRVVEPKGLFAAMDPPAPSSGGGGLFGPSIPEGPMGPNDQVIRVPAGNLRWFVGQPDPTDDSHFTIRYQRGDRFGTMDGWLQDGDSVTFKNRNAEFSTTRPAEWEIREEGQSLFHSSPLPSSGTAQ